MGAQYVLVFDLEGKIKKFTVSVWLSDSVQKGETCILYTSKSIMALSPRVIIFSFSGIILAGTLLLILPFSSRTGAVSYTHLPGEVQRLSRPCGFGFRAAHLRAVPRRLPLGKKIAGHGFHWE